MGAVRIGSMQDLAFGVRFGAELFRTRVGAVRTICGSGWCIPVLCNICCGDGECGQVLSGQGGEGRVSDCGMGFVKTVVFQQREGGGVLSR